MLKAWFERNWKFLMVAAVVIPVSILNTLTIQLVDNKIARLDSERLGTSALRNISCLWMNDPSALNVSGSCKNRIEASVAELEQIPNLRSGGSLNGEFIQSNASRMLSLRQASPSLDFSAEDLEVMRSMSTWIVYESALILDEDLASYVVIDLLNGLVWDFRRELLRARNGKTENINSQENLMDAMKKMDELFHELERKIETLVGVEGGMSKGDIMTLSASLHSLDWLHSNLAKQEISSETVSQVRANLEGISNALLVFEADLHKKLQSSIEGRLSYAILEKWGVHLVSLGCMLISLLIMTYAARAFQKMKHNELLRIQQLHDSEQQLALQKVQLVDASRMTELGVFAGGIAHEVKTPLSVMIGFTEVAMKRAVAMEESKMQGHLQKVLDTGRNLNRMLESFRAMSRSGAVSTAEISTFSQIMQFPLPLVERSATSAQVKIEVECNDDGAPFACVPVQIGQVLLNLFKNSIDAVEALDERWIKVSGFVGENEVVIRVADSGRGIPPEIREKLLHTRFTTKSSDKGTGLGLTISAEICRSHGGSLTIDEASKNTVFVIAFPRFVRLEDFAKHQAEVPADDLEKSA